MEIDGRITKNKIKEWIKQKYETIDGHCVWKNNINYKKKNGCKRMELNGYF